MIRLSPLASETLILSMVKLSWPFSSVLETILGMYLLDAEAEWNGAEAAAEDADAADI
jgi:hypothetical protein